MAKISTLKDNEGNTLYPITSSEAVIDPQGRNMETRLSAITTTLGGKVDEEQGKGLSTNDYTDADKQKLGALPTGAQLTQQLADKQSQLVDSPDITINDSQLSITDLAKYQSLIKQFIAAGGSFDEETHLGSLNGVNDLTYGDIAVIMNAGRLDINNSESFYANNTKLRTNLIPVSGWNYCVLLHTLWGCTSIEVFNARRCVLGYAAFSNCKKLHTIINVIENNGGSITNCFGYCVSLVSFQLKLTSKAVSFSLSDSPLVDLQSFQYMITNAANTNVVTITIHADVYAKLTGDTTNDAYNNLTDEKKEQWTALIASAAAKNITFASA